MTYIFDLDGTLSIPGDRLECLNRTPKNWDEFYERCGEDGANWPIVYIYRAIAETRAEQILLTGRRESCRLETESWLRRHRLTFDELLMRPDGDHRHDTIVKPELMAAAGLTPQNVTAIFEDRASMVNKWRELGFTCLQVAEGNF